jgi:hypothetical protein
MLKTGSRFIIAFLRATFSSSLFSPTQYSSSFLCWYLCMNLKQCFIVAPKYRVFTWTLFCSMNLMHGKLLATNLWGPWRHRTTAILVFSLQYFAVNPAVIAATPKSPYSCWTMFMTEWCNEGARSFNGASSFFDTWLISTTIYL